MERAVGRVKAVVGGLILIVVLVGAAVALGIVGAPSVNAVENRFTGVSDETTTIGTDVVVSNPNPIGVSLGGVTVNYTVDLNGVRLATGTKEGISIDRRNSTLAFETAMSNGKIPAWWVAHIRDGERSELAVHATVRSSTLGRAVSFDPVDREIETDLLAAFNSSERRPVNADQPGIEDPVLVINETGAAWGAVSEAETPMPMWIEFYNPKTTPYVISEIGYTITMNGIEVGAGRSSRSYTIPPKGTETVRTTTVIDNPTLDDWWVSHLERNQVTQLRIDFHARVELPVGGTVRVPLDALTYEETMETDIFGTKAESPTGGEGTAGSDDGTPTDDGGTEPTTTTAEEQTTTTREATTEEETTTTSEETTTEETTTTDDGLLPRYEMVT